ncbi:hypothetical protein JCM10020v2_006876 [Rhodotorula toruloides]
MDAWESKNRFAALQSNVLDPPPPLAPAVQSYAAAAAVPARPAAPSVPAAARRVPAPTKPAPRTSLIAGTANLPETHFLRALPEHRILPCVCKMMVSSSPDPSTLVYAQHMERGDVRLVTRGPSAADLLRRALSAYSAEIVVKMPVEATSLVAHWVPVDADEVEVREKVEEWVGGEGKVAGARWLARRADKSYGLWLVELCNAEDISAILRKAVRQLRPGVWAELERPNLLTIPPLPSLRPTRPDNQVAAADAASLRGTARNNVDRISRHDSERKRKRAEQLVADDGRRVVRRRTVRIPRNAISRVPDPAPSLANTDSRRPATEPVADWSVDTEEEAFEQEGRSESEEEGESTATGAAEETGAGCGNEKDNKKREEKRNEAKEEKRQEAPRGRESRRQVLREKNLLQTEGAVSTPSIPPARCALRVCSVVSSSEDELLLRPNPPPPPSQVRRTTKTSLRSFVIVTYNIHCGRSPPKRSERDVLPAILASSPSQNTLVIAGNFNLHHPAWDPSVLEADDEAEEARLTFEDAGLVHFHEASKSTWSLSRSSWVLDLVLGNLRAEERLVSSVIDEALEYGSDHRPIRTVLAVERADRPPAYPRRLFRKADPATILRACAKLAASVATPATLLTPADLDTEAATLDLMLRETVSVAVPLAKPSRSRFAHRWWSAEVAGAVDEVRRVQTRAYRVKARGNEGDVVEAAVRAAKVATNRAKAMIRREKRRAERAEVEEVNEGTLWKVVKEKLGDRGSAAASTLPLKRDDGTYATSPIDKLALLQPVLLPVVEAPEAEGAADVEQPA